MDIITQLRESKATSKTAYLAGIFCVVGMILTNELARFTSWGSGMIHFLGVILFFIIPAIYYVVGNNYIKEVTGIEAIFRTSFWSEFKNAALRMLVFFLGAATIMIPVILFDELT